VSTPVFDATLDQFGGTPVFWVILELDLHERFDTLMARFAVKYDGKYASPLETLLVDDDTVALPLTEHRTAAAHVAGLDHDEFS